MVKQSPAAGFLSGWRPLGLGCPGDGGRDAVTWREGPGCGGGVAAAWGEGPRRPPSGSGPARRREGPRLSPRLGRAEAGRQPRLPPIHSAPVAPPPRCPEGAGGGWPPSPAAPALRAGDRYGGGGAAPRRPAPPRRAGAGRSAPHSFLSGGRLRREAVRWEDRRTLKGAPGGGAPQSGLRGGGRLVWCWCLRGRDGCSLARSSRLPPPLPPPPCPGSPRSWSRRWCGSLTRSATPTWTGSAPPWPAAAGSAWVSGGRGRAGRPSGLCSGPCSGCRGRRGSASPGLALPRVRGRAVGRPSAPTPEKGGQGARGVPGQPPHPGGTPGQSGPGCERDALLVPHAEASGAASGLVRGCVLMGKANSLICYRCCCLLDVSPGSLGTGTCCALLSAGVCSWGPACRDFLGPIAILKRLNVLRGCGKEGSLPS